MSKASDVAWGRQGGRIVAGAGAGKPWHELVPVRPEPKTETELRSHLIAEHGCAADVVDRHRPSEWKGWHGAEHRTRHPHGRDPMHAGHLKHTHRQYLPKKGGDE